MLCPLCGTRRARRGCPALDKQICATALKPLLADAGKGAGPAFGGDAATVLRRLEDAVHDIRALDQGNRTAFLDLLRRVITLDTPAGGQV